jgi:hypothetical protein
MKNVSILIPEPGPFGETFFEASVRAIVSGSFVNSPLGGFVETVFTLPDHFFAETDTLISKEVAGTARSGTELAGPPSLPGDTAANS